MNSTAQAARQFFVAGVGIVSVGVATRYLSIDEYGAVLAALVLVSLFSVASDFGLSAMAVRAIAREPEDDVAILNSAFWVWVLFAVPTGLAILVISQVVYTGPDDEITRTSVLILLSSLVVGPFGGMANVRAIADQRVWIVSVSSMIARALSLGAVVLAAVLDLGPLGVAAAYASGFVLEAIVAVALVRPRLRPRAGLNGARIRSLTAAAIPLGVVMIVNGLYFKLDAFMLSVLGSNADVAVYGVAYKAFELLVALPAFVMVTLLPELSRVTPDDERFTSLVQKAFTAMCLLAAPLIGLSLLGTPAIVALGGHKYADGGLVVTFVIIAVALACVQGVFGHTLVSQGRQGVLLRVSLVVLAANAVLNVIAIPTLGVEGVGLALILTEVLSLTYTLLVYRRIAPLPRLHMPWRVAAAVGVMAAAMSVRFLVSGIVAELALAGVLGLASYVLALVALRAVPPYVRDAVASLVRPSAGRAA